ncbi:hypothetical protein P154DRAFT_531840 [Amniculicola lignicola CBS 123094]|uniref:MYND-type domain-containing protein n=1 Tax=Amniculicola lignicola CBS 123094 TaxID=1392246 RepID=A0A6A5WVI9_9PLEO|nr:hypothetical protein P154DRAFT_531840 [Amniculicola lignicola CBS 123094]
MSSAGASTSATSYSACLKCEKPGTKRCTRCSTQYCSDDCEANDSNIHNILCESMSDREDRPGAGFRRAVYFPVNESAPRFVWVPFNEEDWAMDNHYVRQNLFHDVEFFQYKTFDENPILKRRLGYSVFLWHDDEFKVNGQPENQALQSVSKVDLSRHWRGPLLAVVVQVDEFGGVTDVQDANPDVLSILADIVHLKTGRVNTLTVFPFEITQMGSREMAFFASLMGNLRRN